jgi:cold shock CspA family protein
MAKSHQTFSKKEAEKNKQKKKQEKEHKKEERKANAKNGKSLEDMMAYVDENGNLTSTAPDPNKKKKEVKEEDMIIGVRRVENVEESPIRTGIVTFFNDSKGFGFIKDLDSQESIFVHVNGLKDKIKENNKVTFEITMGAKGANAVEVKLVK